MENCIIYDWLTVSFQNLDKDTLLHVLGLLNVPWEESDKGSRLRYGHRLSYDGMSLHYTDDWDLKHNAGVCLELSGQGCRDYETFGKGDWWLLFEFIRLAHGTVTRLDIAYDDFTGVLPLRIMYDMADKWYFTSRTQRVRLMKESDDSDPLHAGLSVCHGSKSSEVYIRVYDKRVERHAWDQFEHWIRFEVQLRGSNCAGFLSASGSLGERFRGVIANYVNYRCPDPADSNRRRWKLAPWWCKFLESASALSVHQTKDIEYNKDRLDAHIYDRNHNALKAEILSDGLPAFLSRIFGHTEDMPAKYKGIMQASANSAEIQRILGYTSSGSQVLAVAGQLDSYLDASGINPLKAG